MAWTQLYAEHNLLDPELPAVLVAKVADETHWSVQCPDCLRWNTHGAEVGHRRPHCRCDARLDRGYVIAPPGARFAPYPDHCPKCGLTGGSYTPVDLDPQKDRGIAASYICRESHGWVSSWGDLPYGPARRAAVPSAERRCVLYRHYDVDGVLLYVGITESPEGRTREHARSSVWVRYAHHMTAEWFDSRDDAEAAERAAIRNEMPVFNIAHAVGDPDGRIRAYQAEAGR